MGKVFFFDIMGFVDLEVMCGGWFDDWVKVFVNFEYWFCLRYYVLVCFVCEGLCLMVIIINYDMLLEGVWWLSGFEVENVCCDFLFELEKIFCVRIV